MQFMRYAWSALLLVAAILSPDVATTVTLLVAGVATVLLAIAREKRLAKLVSELSDLLALRRLTSGNSVALERSLSKLQRHMLLLAVVSELVIFLALLVGNLDITVARNYALLVLVALAPLGLEAELAALLRFKHKRSSETVRTAVGYAIEDAHALLAVVGLSFAGTLLLDIPPALSALQILLITCVARPLLSGRALQATPHKIDQRWRVMLTSVLTYGSFVFFFIRHYLEPRFADTINPVTWQATTVAMLTFVACQAAVLIFNPQAPRVAFYRVAALTSVLLAAVYIPIFNDYLMTTGPAAADWVWIILTGMVYISLYLLLQHVREQHSRKAILALHRR